MWNSVWWALALTANPPCAALDGWNAGRSGTEARATCDGEDYREAHRLGDALKQLQDEHARIERGLPGLEPAARAAARRRQRQLEVDLEAIRGLATIKAWPLEPAAARRP